MSEAATENAPLDEAAVDDEKSRKDNVQVCVRCRPLSETEIAANYRNVITVDPIGGTVSVASPAGVSEPPKVSSSIVTKVQFSMEHC